MSEESDIQGSMEQNYEQEQDAHEEFKAMLWNLDNAASSLYLALRAVEWSGQAGEPCVGGGFACCPACEAPAPSERTLDSDMMPGMHAAICQLDTTIRRAEGRHSRAIEAAGQKLHAKLAIHMAHDASESTKRQIRKEIDDAALPKKQIWSDGDEMIVADSELEAFLMSGYTDFEEWDDFRPLADETPIAILCDEAGNTAEDGKPLTRTAAEWCKSEPKGHLASTYG